MTQLQVDYYQKNTNKTPIRIKTSVKVSFPGFSCSWYISSGWCNASFQGPPWNIMLQNTIYLMQNDTVSAIRGFQQVSKPRALSFCIKGHRVCWSMVVWALRGRKWRRGVLPTYNTNFNRCDIKDETFRAIKHHIPEFSTRSQDSGFWSTAARVT